MPHGRALSMDAQMVRMEASGLAAIKDMHTGTMAAKRHGSRGAPGHDSREYRIQDLSHE